MNSAAQRHKVTRAEYIRMAIQLALDHPVRLKRSGFEPEQAMGCED